MILIYSIIAYLLGIQINIKELDLLSCKYNYKLGSAQIVTFLVTLISILIFVIDLLKIDFVILFAELIISFLFAFGTEFIWAKFNTQNRLLTLIYRISVITIFSLAEQIFIKGYCISPFIVMGIYMRNNRFGSVHRKDYTISSLLKRKITKKNYEESNKLTFNDMTEFPNFCHAGNQNRIKDNLPYFNVLDYGIKANIKIDQTDKINKLINTIGKKGGGILHFPKGSYYFNTEKNALRFIQINHSNIVLEGDLDKNGTPISKLINCGNLAYGKAYPWLSPFLITTGENLQRSNIFFGLQFRKRKNIVMRSGSLSDPGSDGNLLEPDFATTIIKSSKKNDTLLYVADSSKVGKYIMLGMYNTDKDATLLKKLLGINELRKEWQAANRAGAEEAPSFQWLIEVRRIIDTNTIELVQPLWIDINMEFAPVIFNVEMLENISIRNLYLTSTWNGLFRHHGYRGYYTSKQAQEMDYGWNAINMKRVAHGNIENIIIENYTNPLYVLDSRNITCEGIIIKGYDGHQGIKMYAHACDNLFRNIKFYNHYADMLGGEGNSYGNVFSDIHYLNPSYNPVDFDFHGFSEGPMSPPMYTLFELIEGFSHIHLSGAFHMQPACGQYIYWWNCRFEGEKKNSSLYINHYHDFLSWRGRTKILIKTCLKSFAKMELTNIRNIYKKELALRQKNALQPKELCIYCKNHYIVGGFTDCSPSLLDNNYVKTFFWGRIITPKSLYTQNSYL